MLSELSIENFAIIDHLELHFTPGLVTFTGETGAGKSIIIDAVEVLLGGRAEAVMIRSEAERAIIEAVFEIPEAIQPQLMAILEREALLEEKNRVTLGREIRRNGRNVARVNGRNVNTALLTEIGELLVDVHGQSEHLSLLRVRKHLQLLDSYANAEDSLADYRKTYRRLQSVRRSLEELRQAESDAARRTDLLSYQINEIEAARLQPGEEDELKEERNRLANAEGLATLAQEAVQILDEGMPEAASITDLLGNVTHAISSLSKLDPSQETLAEQSQVLFENLADLTRSLRLYQESIEFNPKRLDQVEERLGLLHNLKRKYGKTLEEVLQYATQARQQLDTILHAGEKILQLESEEAELLQTLAEKGQRLSEIRRSASAQLARAVEAELADLHMNGARFEVDFKQRLDPEGVTLQDGSRVAFDASGIEQVEFLVAPNPGEGLKPLVKIASGGETSRLMLALKNVLTRADQIPTLIFDEIDQGIGGRVGTVVGLKLWNLGRMHQVLCVTHLPQLAAFGDQHFQVAKHVQEGRTHTVVEALTREKRLLELAQMMGEVSEGTRRSAQELLQMATAHASADKPS
ncbi:MAG: DNA repair protein RecN [Anaerolineales bacterium]